MESSFGNTNFFVEAVLGGLLAHRSRSRVFATVVSPEGEDWRPEATLAFNRNRPLEHLSSRRLIDEKHLTAALLADAGLPVPEGRVFYPSDSDGAGSYATSLGWPVVVKPAGGLGGRGVTIGVSDEASLTAAMEAASPKGGLVLVQRQYEGTLYRILAGSKRVYSARFNVPAHVIGDGVSTVEELVVRKNELRAAHPHLGARKRRIRLDGVAGLVLREQGLSGSSVPEAGSAVALSRVANSNVGSDTIDVTDDLHPSISDLACRSVGAIPGLVSSGIDMLLPDGHLVDASNQDAVILEHNWNHGLGGHLFPWEGSPRNVVRMLLEDAAERIGLAVDQPPPDPAVIVLPSGVPDPEDVTSVLSDSVAELGVRVTDEARIDQSAFRIEGPRLAVAAALDRLTKASPELLAVRADRIESPRELEVPGLGKVRLSSHLVPCPWASTPTATARQDRRPTTFRVRVTGSVTGVGFRRHVARIARRNGVNGWVRNTHDGHVEMLLSGSRVDVEQVLAAVYDGPRAADVRRVTVRLTRASPSDAFRVRRTSTPKSVSPPLAADHNRAPQYGNHEAREPNDADVTRKPPKVRRSRVLKGLARKWT